MKCCKKLDETSLQSLPFERVLAFDYYDGPTQGFTRCLVCGQTYAFRLLDIDDLENRRILGFAPLNVGLDEIALRLGIEIDKGFPVKIIPPQGEDGRAFCEKLLQARLTRIAIVDNFLVKTSMWRDVSRMNTNQVTDWFSFLGISKSHQRSTGSTGSTGSTPDGLGKKGKGVSPKY